ncbi:MAG: glycosyltransferase family 39 protein [Candidatus Mariimomonas ferrooxydans]
MNDKLFKVCLLLCIIFLVITGITLLVVSYLSFELLKVKFDSYALSGSADKFTIEFFKRIAFWLRFIAIVIFLAGGLIYILRQQIRQYISNIITSSTSLLNELEQHLKEFIVKEDKVHLITLLIIFLAAIAVRLLSLFHPMQTDEAYTFVVYASKPLYVGLTYYSHPNNHLFHTFLVHMSYLLLGNHPWVIRLPAFFAGILLVPASYLVIRILYNKHAALLTAGIVASSDVLIKYSTHARGYSLISLNFLFILALAAYLMQSKNPAAWLLFAILSALGFYTIPIMLYPFGIVVIWLFLSIVFQKTNISRSHLLRDLFFSSIITAILTFMLYVPVFAVTGLESVIANPYVISESWSDFIAELPPSLLFLWNNWNRDIPPAINILMVIGFFISLVFHKRLSIHRVPIIMAVGVWCIPVLIVQRLIPYERVWLFLLPIYIGFASSGLSFLLSYIKSKISLYNTVIFSILVITLTVWLGWNSFQSQSRRAYDDYEQVTIFMKDYLKPGDRVLTEANPHPSMMYYFKRYNVPARHLISDLNSSQRILVIIDKQTDILEEFLDKKGVSITNYSAPKLLQRFSLASLYELNRVNEGSFK